MSHSQPRAPRPAIRLREAGNAGIQQAMVGTVWTDGGCKSSYLSQDGSYRTLWPSFSDTPKRLLAGFDIAESRVSA